MIKKIIIGTLAFIVGIGIAFYTESFFRSLIQDIFQWSTSGKIKFTGKNFYVFSNKLYFFTFGIAFLILALENHNQKVAQILKSVILFLLIFEIVLIGISTIDANLKVVECTACDDGIRKLHWNEISYGLIIGISAIMSTIPSLIKIIKRRIAPRSPKSPDFGG